MLIGQNKGNLIINGRMDFWQRNTTFITPASGSYTADRFRVSYDGTIGTFTVSREAFTLGQTEVPGEPVYFYRWDQTVAGSASTFRRIEQRIESVLNASDKKVTMSVYMKADAARTVSVDMVQHFGTGGSPSADTPIASQNIDLTTDWQRFVLTFDVPSVSGKTLGTDGNDYLTLRFNLPVNVIMTIDIANVMLVESEAAADFELAGKTIAGELILCERFYEKSYQLNTVPGTITNLGTIDWYDHASSASTSMQRSLEYRTVKNRNPSAIFYSPVTGAQNQVRSNDGALDRPVSYSNITTKNLLYSWSHSSGSRVTQFHYILDAEL